MASFGAERRHPRMLERVETPDGRIGYVMGAHPEKGGRYVFSVYPKIGRGGGIHLAEGPSIGEYTAFELRPA